VRITVIHVYRLHMCVVPERIMLHQSSTNAQALDAKIGHGLAVYCVNQAVSNKCKHMSNRQTRRSVREPNLLCFLRGAILCCMRRVRNA
jgi:hypothetical protein